jgi:branched-chain amino acid transport system ATP-binding protein
MSALLEVSDISVSFGGLKAVQRFTLKLQRGDLHGLIGPNGAGKTTVFNLFTGVYRPHEGSIVLDGQLLIGRKPHQIARAGLSRTFQSSRLFPDLTVLDNVRIGCHLRVRHGMARTVMRSALHCAEERAIAIRAEALLEIFDLQKRRFDLARNLPYGDQRRLEIARAMATDPKVLLLDEPAAGMNTQEKIELRQLIQSIRKRFGLTILLIEHDMGVVMDICETITVLDYGQTIAVGTPAEIQRNPKVIEAYLGTPREMPAEAKV